MTRGVRLGFFREWQRGCRDGDKPILIPVVIPACLQQAGEGWNPGKRGRGGEGMADFAGCPPSVVAPVVIPAMREWLIKTTGFRPAPE